MFKIAAVGMAVLFVAASPTAYAQSTQPQEKFSAADWSALTDLRVDLVKSALRLTPDQMKFWPAVENAIRARANDRQARISKLMETTGARAQESSIETLRNRDPIAFLNRRADALAQRSADLKQLASAWQPLYTTLTPE